MTLLLLLGGYGPAPTDHPSDGMTPGLTIEVAFGFTWQDTPAWTDVTDWVSLAHGIEVVYGRTDELQPFDTGTLTLTLDNKDRRFDPTYADGDYFGDVKPMVPIRVVANWDSQNYPLYYGFVEGWPQTSSVGNRESWVNITANDLLEMLAQSDYTGGVWTLDDPVLGRLDSGNRIGGGGAISGTAGDRVEAILDLTGVPAAQRDIAAGVAELADSIVDGTPRDELQLIEQAEYGWLYVDPTGVVVFLARNSDRTVPRMAESQGTFTDADTSMPYAGLEFTFDRKYVFNDVRRERTGGTSQIVTDDTSIDDYFRRKHELTDLPLAYDSDALGIGSLFLHRHATPTLRPEPLVIDPGNNRSVLFPQVLGRQLLDRITLERTPQEIGDPIEADYRIEGVTHRIGLRGWTTTWPLSPVDDTAYWTLDDPVLGLLDSGNVVGA